MSMTVTGDTHANKAINVYNANKTQAEKSFEKLSNGMKIVGAGDNSSAYAISERMREMIRSFSQDDKNVQNSSALVRTAERAIDQIVQNLQTMRELAVDSANDSNTDDDRRVLQKEFDQLIHTINDIAEETNYNSKILLDGRYDEGGITTIKPGAGGINTNVTDVTISFSARDNATATTTLTNYSSYADWRYTADKGFSSSGGSSFSVTLNFSGMQTNGSYPETLHGQGFAILCGGCMQYINILFDATKTAAESTYDGTSNKSPNGQVNNQARAYVIGVKDVKSSGDLASAIFDGVAAVSDKIIRSSFNASNTADDLLLDTNHELRIKRDPNDHSDVYIQKRGPALLFKEGTIPNPVTDPLEPVVVEEKIFNPLWTQHGTTSGQRLHLYISDMRTKAMGLDGVDVRTRDTALNAMGRIDSAIEYALNEATDMGAYLQRLNVTRSSITSMNENVQAFESNIRDADMAKEVTDYMLNNLLSNSSQAMVAQANQNQSSVLGLLR